jgi:energy-coupling factor transporter ATP-binding protein EcfA2
VTAVEPVPPTLELRGVTYRYPGERRPALHDVSLAIGPGEIVGVTGPNEAGKSTLCLVAAGLAPASVGGELAGEVRIDGAALAGLRPWEIATRVGIVFAEAAGQRSGVSDTVLAEVAFGPVNLGLPAAESRARAEATLERLGIAGLAERRPDRLSGGQQQLVAIASMLAMEPRALVLDEPVAELDRDGRRLVGETLRSLARSGTAILVTEHDLAFLGGLCERLLAIDGGHVTERGS